MTYVIVIETADGDTLHVPMDATTDDEAIATMRAYLADPQRYDDAKLYLAWMLISYTCAGYLNPDGNASATGRPWTTMEPANA